MSSTKSPKYIPDTPHGEDFFAVHSQIAEMLNKTIVEEDVTKQSFTFGLLGSWGSGKSLTIGKLRDKLANESNILFIEFDVWKYVDTSLYRSILIDFESALKTKTGIPASYKNGIATSEGENLTEILYKSRQTMTPEVKKHDNKLLNLISEWEKTWYGKVGSFLFLRSANMFRVCGKYFLSRSELFYFLIVISFVFSCLYYYRSNLEAAYPTLTDTFLRPIFKFIAITCLGFSAVELFREAFKDFFKEMLPKTNNNIIITSPPTFAQDQFEIIFRGVIEDIAKNSGKKFVIVFDNIDRCESNVTIQILTGLKTFLDQKNCFYVIPCDDLRIKNHLKASNRAEDDYLDKIFQAFIRIPQIEGDDKVTFIEKCLAKADFELSKNDELKISQILTLAYKADTPRQIKRFFNDFISYYRLADVVDPQKRFLLKDISLFTLMIAIKQKWPELENFILNNSNFFEEQETFKGNTSIPSDAYQFVERCAGWIDHSIDPAIFIYLKNSNSSGNRIQKIFIEKLSDFVLNSALISQMERYLNNLVATGKYILFEDGIQRLKEIIEAQPTTLDTHILEEVFKLYFRMLSKHNTFTYDNKKQSFFITHAKFIANNVDQIKKLERNQIAPIERQICQAIRSAGANAEMKELYNSIKESFAITNLRLIFNQINYDEFIRLQQLTLLTPSDKLSKLVSNVDLESIANSISFNRDESPFMQFLSYGKEVQEYSKAKQITAAKVNESLSQITSHAAPHQYDPYIISGLKNLLPEHWTGNHKSNFNSYINTRLSVLFQHGHIDLAVKYSIEAIRNGAPSVDTYFAPNGQQNLNLQQNFNSLADQIDEAALLTAMNTPNLRGHFLRLANGYNLQQKILSKVPTAFYDNSLNTLYDGNLQMLVNLLT
ncbi:MAG: P-loop NTPase fold protein, partial [Bacteroidia bacterium]